MEMTQKDIEKVQEEINYRKTVLRPELLERLKSARSLGDLSENFEYTMAKRENNRNNSRVRYLENMIRFAKIIEDHTDDMTVGLGKLVTVYIPEDDATEQYKIVTSIRGDSTKGRISTDSPMGKALMKHKAGDEVTVQVNDAFSYAVRILKVETAVDDNSDAIRQY